MVARSLFLFLLTCAACPCLGPAKFCIPFSRSLYIRVLLDALFVPKVDFANQRHQGGPGVG